MRPGSSPIRQQSVAERGRRLVPATCFFGLAPLIALMTAGDEIPRFVIGVMIVLMAICTWCWVRLRFTGVRVTEDELIVTSWWTRRVYKKTDIARFREEAYFGVLFVTGWQVGGGVLQSGIVHAEMRSGKSVPLHGNVCNRRTARRTSEVLNRWVGSELGAGTGPRRAASNRRDRRPESLLE